MTPSQAVAALRVVLATRLLDGVGALPGIADLLATDPQLNTPALYNAKRSTTPQIFDAVTYRVSQGRTENALRGPAGTGASGLVVTARVELEVWTRQPQSERIEGIAGRIEALLHNSAFDLSNGARMFRGLAVSSQPDLYDDKTKSWFGLYAYELAVQASH